MKRTFQVEMTIAEAARYFGDKGHQIRVDVPLDEAREIFAVQEGRANVIPFGARPISEPEISQEQLDASGIGRQEWEDTLAFWTDAVTRNIKGPLACRACDQMLPLAALDGPVP